MKFEFENVELEIVDFDAEDIVCSNTSGWQVGCTTGDCQDD